MSVVSTRPELIKMSEIIKKLDKYTEHIFVHTGQNYDYELNGIFYEDLGLRQPDYYLDCGAGHTAMEFTGDMFIKMDKLLREVKPDAFVVLGDTNGALSAIVAKRLKIPVFHLEAGNRCFDDNVPEEINRRILDHISDVNMVYTENSRRYLLAEGVAKDRIFIMGSPMAEIFENLIHDDTPGKLFNDKGDTSEYFLMSIHRDENTEIKENLLELVKAMHTIVDTYNIPIILSTHPRLMKKFEEQQTVLDPRIIVHKPFGFKEYIALQRNAKCVISDSGTIS